MPRPATALNSSNFRRNIERNKEKNPGKGTEKTETKNSLWLQLVILCVQCTDVAQITNLIAPVQDMKPQAQCPNAQCPDSHSGFPPHPRVQ